MEKNAGSFPYTLNVVRGYKYVQTLYIEGTKNSSAVNDVKISALLVPDVPEDISPVEKYTTVYQVDLDVDSNNNNAFAFAGFDKAEDEIEASVELDANGKKKPGKYLLVNAGFNAANNDATPGWGDGFNCNPGTLEDDVASVSEFTPLRVVLKEPFDPNTAEIEFFYSASDPASVAVAVGEGTPTHQFKYSLPSDGHLRIWKNDAPGTRDKRSVASGGHYVPASAKVLWSTLSAGRTADLYLEAAKQFPTLGGLGIKVVVSEGNVVSDDYIRVTSVYLNEAVVTVTANPNAQYAIIADNYTATNGPAVNYEVSAKFVPDGVDCSVSPLNNVRCAIVQNVSFETVALDLFDLLLPIRNIGPNPPWPSPGYIDIPLTGTQAYSLFPPRVNDSVDWTTNIKVPAGLRRNWFPIYMVTDPTPASTATPLGDILGKPLNCSGGRATKSDDTPSSGALSSAIFSCGGQLACLATYRTKRIRREVRFITWCAGFDVANLQIYPLRETTWQLILDSDVPGNQIATSSGIQVSPTVVPVRSPSANAAAAGAFTPPNGFPIVPTPGGVTIRVP
jgi:hypothetical protein